MYTTDIVSSFKNSFNLNTWKKFPEKKFICLPQIVGWTSTSKGSVWNSDSFSVPSSSTICRHCKDIRQVQLDDEDKDFHRVLWKYPNDTEVKTDKMTRVTYRIASSSYHTIRLLKALPDSCINSNLRLAIKNAMYVDDLLTGASDVQHATQLQDEIIAELKTACFDVRKWTSSVSSLVERLPSSFRETSDEITAVVYEREQMDD